MTCPRCQRTLIGTTRWCLVHGDQADFGPYAVESQRDRQKSAAVNQSRERPWEDDEAENLVLPGFDLPFQRQRAVSTFDAAEMANWTRAFVATPSMEARNEI